MESRRTTDFTSGSIPRHLITFATPMFIGNLLQAAYNTVDSIWVGRFLGADALASVSVGFPIIFALIAMVMGLTMATTTLVSQYYGAKSHDMVAATVANSLTLLTMLGAVVAIVGYVLRWPLLRLLNAPANIIGDAAAYLGVYTLGFLPTFVYNVSSAILRGLGDSRSPMKFLAYATVTNIILDPIMIFGLGPMPKMGVVGAAWATVISQAISALAAAIHLFSKFDLGESKIRLARLDRNLTWLTIKIGLPAGAQQTLMSLGMMVVMSIVNAFGSIIVAGAAIGQRIEQFATMPAMSVGLAVTALVGQNLGAGRHDRVSQIVRWGFIVAGSITAIVMALALLVPQVLLAPFTQDPEAAAAATIYLRWSSLGFIPLAAMFVFVGVLRGAGDTVPTFFFTLISLWLVRVPLVTVLSRTSLRAEGVWMGMAVGPFIGFALSYLYYRTGRWKNKAVVGGTPVGAVADSGSVAGSAGLAVSDDEPIMS